MLGKTRTGGFWIYDLLLKRFGHRGRRNCLLLIDYVKKRQGDFFVFLSVPGIFGLRVFCWVGKRGKRLKGYVGFVGRNLLADAQFSWYYLGVSGNSMTEESAISSIKR